MRYHQKGFVVKSSHILANYLLENDYAKASEYLNENFHPNAVKKMYGETISKEQEITVEEVMTELIDNNPMPEKEYLMFMAKSWIGKRFEDLEDIAETISEVNQAKNDKFQGAADILVKIKNNKISYEEVLKFLDPIRNSNVDIDFSKYKLVVESDGYKAYEIDSFVKKPGTIYHEAFFGTEWCVRREKMFKQYKAPFYLIAKGQEREALIHFPSMQFKDKMDQPIIEKKYLAGVVSKLLTHLKIPYVYKDFAMGFSRNFSTKDLHATIFSDDFMEKIKEMHTYKIDELYFKYSSNNRFSLDDGKVAAEEKYKLEKNTIFIEYNVKFGKIEVSWYDLHAETPDIQKTFDTENWKKVNAMFKEVANITNKKLRESNEI